jgi:hypothetical protein
MDHRTIGDHVGDSLVALEHAIDTDSYDRLAARDRAFIQEARYCLQQIGESQ